MAPIQLYAQKSSEILLLCFMINLGLAIKNELRATYNTSDCICPGQTATFECTTVGGEFTVWNGSIMEQPECTETIVLQHFKFLSRNESCNDGAVDVQGINISNGCYTSRLTVLVTPSLDGRDVSCSVDYGYGADFTLIDTVIINITTVPPDDVQLITANPRELVFSWSPPTESCPSLTYYIDAKNCGICQNTTTTNTTYTCTNFALSAVCTMNVFSVTCENLTSMNSSNVVNVNLTASEIAGDIKTVPYYFNGDARLLRVKTQFHTGEKYNISNGIDGSAVDYTITYFDLNSGSICGSAIIQPSSCINETCTHIFEISSSSCLPASNISVRVFATNVLGQGPVKNSSTLIYGTNSFVIVKFSSNTRRITCKFLNLSQGTTKECSVTITYGVNCSQLLDTYSGKNVSDSLITSPIAIMDDVTEYCFSATTAQSISTFNRIVVIEGTLYLISNRENVPGWLIAIIILIILAVLGMGIIIYL